MLDTFGSAAGNQKYLLTLMRWLCRTLDQGFLYSRFTVCGGGNLPLNASSSCIPSTGSSSAGVVLTCMFGQWQCWGHGAGGMLSQTFKIDNSPLSLEWLKGEGAWTGYDVTNSEIRSNSLFMKVIDKCVCFFTTSPHPNKGLH